MAFAATKISICSISLLISEVEKMICMPMKTSLIPTSVTILKSPNGVKRDEI